jgi:uncharacterized protein YheU (UPF0270 family)
MPDDEFSQLTHEDPPPGAVPLEEEGIEVSHELLKPETLEQLILAFVLREGTDYGEREVPLARKIEQIREQLETGDLKIVFDLSTESGSIISKK